MTKKSLREAETMNKTAFKSDIKKIVREPILMLFMAVPFMAIFAIKAILVFGLPLLVKYTGFALNGYLGYVEVLCLLLSPGMLGAVSAFMMIDERDGGIYELMSITPIGYSGYIANRLVMPFVLSMIYTLLFHYILHIYSVSFVILLLIALIAGMQSIVIALFLFSLADDKVKGLTLAKALNIFILTAGADLLDIPFVSFISSLIPFYWSTKILMQPCLFSILIGISVNTVWVGIAVLFTLKHR